MANEAHKIKLLVLWDILCKNTDENHALNTDELSELLALRGLNVSRKILVQDIATLCDNGYEVLSYKKKYHYYYVVNRSLETAEVVMLADVINASKLPVAQKKALIGRLAETLCTHQAESISKHIISLDKGRKGSSSFIYNVDAIERAINENKQISFLYFNYDEKHKKVYRKNGNRYTVSPAFMVWNKDNYYLLCFSKGHDDSGIEREMQRLNFAAECAGGGLDAASEERRMDERRARDETERRRRAADERYERGQSELAVEPADNASKDNGNGNGNTTANKYNYGKGD